MRAFDLLAGMGGFRAGAELSTTIDVDFVAWSEIDPYARRTYEALFGSNGEVFVDDIQKVTRTESEKEEVDKLAITKERTRRIQESLPDFDLLLSGFPCQPHSLMGNRLGSRDDRGSLFYDIAAILQAMKPAHFVLENVRAIKSVNQGRYFDDIVSVLTNDLDYNLEIWELNAADFGMPQVRRRLFFVGSTGDLPPTPPQPVPKSERDYRTTWHLLEKNVDAKYFLSKRITKTILKDKHKGYNRKAEINRLTARPLCRTMHKMHRASQDNYYSVDFIHGEYDEQQGSVNRAKQVKPPEGAETPIRRITPREALRIQSFPEALVDRAISSGNSDTRLYMHAGNAVPPLMVRAVIDHMFGSKRR